VLPSVFIENLIPPSPCTPGTVINAQYFRIQIEDSYLREFPLGSTEISVFVRDIDAISGISPTLGFNLIGSEPTLDFSAMPLQFTSGNKSTLIVKINDLDGIENMECSVLLKDQDDITLYSNIFIPMADGLWTLDWTPPGTDATNHTLYFACLDETSLSVSKSILIQVRDGLSTPLNDQDSTKHGSRDTSTIFVGVALIGLLLIMILTTLLFSRSKEEVIDQDEQLPDEVWANQNREDSNERLAEMAGITESQNREWTDEDLLGAGWTHEQIEIYRVEQQNATNSKDEILSIIEEE